MDCQLLWRAVLLLHNGSHLAFLIPKNTAIAERISQNGCQYGSRCIFLPAGLCQGCNRFTPKKRGIAADDKHITLPVRQERSPLHHRMACAKLLCLVDKIHMLS